MHKENVYAKRAKALGMISADRSIGVLDEKMADYHEADGERAQDVQIGGAVTQPLLLALSINRSCRPIPGTPHRKSVLRIGFHCFATLFLQASSISKALPAAEVYFYCCIEKYKYVLFPLRPKQCRAFSFLYYNPPINHYYPEVGCASF